MFTFGDKIGIYLKILKTVDIIILFLILTLNPGVSSEFDKLPNCQENDPKGLVLVSTLDGKFSVLNSKADLLWQIDTGPGPLLTSNIHNLELTNNGQWIRIIPSLSGTLYTFDGQNVNQIPVTADSLLKSSFKYSDDLVIAGGMEVRKYGVSLWNGDIYYTCSVSKCTNSSNNHERVGDVLIIERSTQTVRAIEPRSGQERWNFTVGVHDVKIAQIGCIHSKDKYMLTSSHITAILPEGIIRISNHGKEKLTLYEYKFSTPIVHIWRWDGSTLVEVDIFETNQVIKDPHANLSPAIYVGMHMKQLYIRESTVMQNFMAIGHSHSRNTAVTESTSVIKIPWKPVPASTVETDDDSTALSLLYASEYMNGNGYYLYSATDITKEDDMTLNITEDNLIINEEHYHPLDFFVLMGRETLLILSFTVLFIFVMNSFSRTEKVVIHHVAVPTEKSPTTNDNVQQFSSRYLNDFETLRCLGKGGFGVVFEVKQKIDECSYAIKRITLPSGEESRNRVLREVKALAKLDHQNIVRYFNSWVESPPCGWQDDYDKNWIKNDDDEDESDNGELSETNSDRNRTFSKRSHSVSVDIEFAKDEDLPFSANNKADDSIDIVFENTTSKGSLTKSYNSSISSNADTSCTEISDLKATLSITEHIRKKNFWRNPSRAYHSWDFSNTLNKQKKMKRSASFLYIQMQLCQKESLKEWLSSNYTRHFDDILSIFKQILSAVHYVHLQGLIHRDLKPSNIFFSLEGQIKVGDFGLVKDMEENLDLVVDRSFNLFANHTRDVGTKLYMSPEQLKTGHYNHKVDIYSLGLIFFELLVPFSTEMERISVLTNLKDGKYPPKFSDNYPQELSLLQMMICKDPGQRLTTIGIKAKPPLNCPDSKYGEKHYFELPK